MRRSLNESLLPEAVRKARRELAFAARRLREAKARELLCSYPGCYDKAWSLASKMSRQGKVACLKHVEWWVRYRKKVA